MKSIKSALVGIIILSACLAWSATSYAGMMGGGHHGPNMHHDGYDAHHGEGSYGGHHGDGAHHGSGYDGHHGGSNDDHEPGWDHGHGNRSMDDHFDGAEEDSGPYPGDASGRAHDNGGQHRQGP